jgi:hypothetical protein
MKNIIKLEELAMLLISVYALYQFEVAWWWYLLVFIGPDISMLGYLAGNKAGAISYDLFHHKAIGIAFIITGYFFHANEIVWTGLVLFGHSSFDRMMGYGLKFFDGFQHTHLGKIGKEQ